MATTISKCASAVVIMGISYALCHERVRYRRSSSFPSELEKGQHGKQHANVKADEHADAQQD